MLPEHEEIHVALCALPIREKLAHLVFALLLDDPLATTENLLETCTILAQHLPPDKRTAVRWQMAAALAELEARWN